MGILNLNILRYIKLCLKYWYLFVISILIFGGIATTYILLRQPTSEVVAQLMLKDDAPNAGILTSQLSANLPLGDMFGSSSTDNETMVLASHSVFLGTVKDLGLNVSYTERMYPMIWYQTPLNSAVKLEAQEGIADTIRVSLRFDVVPLANGNVDVKVKYRRKNLAELENKSFPVEIKTSYGDFTLLKTPYFDTTKANKFRIMFGSYDAAAESCAKAVKIYAPDRKTDFIDMSMITPDPKFGKLFLNTLISNYVRVSNLFKLEKNRQSLEIVNDRLSSISGELMKVETDMESFKTKNDITDVDVDASYLIGKTGSLEGSLLETSTRYDVLKKTKDFISAPENKYSLIPDVGVSQIDRYNSLILSRISLLNTAKSNNNALKHLEQQIDAVRDNVIESVNQLMKSTAISLDELKREEKKVKSKIDQIPSLEREYVSLKRDNMLLQQIYLFLLQQREEINMTMVTTSLPAQVIDAPHEIVLSKSLTPVKAGFMGAFFGALLVAAYVLLVLMRKYPVTASSEIENSMKAPRFHHIGAFDDNGTIMALADSQASEDLRFLRTEVQSALKSCSGNVVAVTSVNAGEGKTTVAVNLAISLALTGKRVALVDSDLRSPHVASVLGIPVSGNHLEKYLRGIEASAPTLEEYAIDRYSTLNAACVASPVKNASDVLATDKYAKFVSDLSSGYDYVVIDTANIKGYSDIYYVTDVADVTLVVCRNGYISLKDVDMLNNLFSEGKLKRMAIVENDFTK